MATAVLQLTDCDACFEGDISSNGIITQLRWIDGARKALLLGAPYNCQLVQQNLDTFRWAQYSLIGPLPQGDRFHDWDGSEFYKFVPPQVGPQGPPGPPGQTGLPGLQGPQGPKGDTPHGTTSLPFTY